MDVGRETVAMASVAATQCARYFALEERLLAPLRSN
jgi:hypothetical protein